VNRNYIIVIALGIATLIAFLLLNYFAKPNVSGDSSEEVERLREELEHVDQQVLEFELITQTQEEALKSQSALLEDKYVQIKKYDDQLQEYEQQIENMKSKVDDMERKGSLDAEEIEKLRAKIRKAQTTVGKASSNLADAYRSQVNVLVADLQDVTRGMDSVVMEVNSGDSIILALTRENERFKKSLIDCNGAKTMAEVDVPKFPILSAESFKFYSIEAGGSNPRVLQQASASTKPRLEQDKLQRLNICFNLKGNELVPSGQKKLYLFLKTKRGKQYRSNKMSGSTLKDGRNVSYTRSNEVTYQKSTGIYQVCMDYIPDAGDKFSLGEHKVEIVYDGEVIGNSTFWIKP